MNGVAEWRENEYASMVSDIRISYSDAAPEERLLASLADRYRGRGFLRAAKEHGENMDAMEHMAKQQAPEYYRWDELCSKGRGAQFRSDSYLGRQVMDVNDFAAYFAECRAARTKAEEAQVQQNAPCPVRTKEQSRRAMAVRQAGKTKDGTSDRAVAFAKAWLCPDDPALRRVGTKRRMPVTVISMFAVIAISLMLIVSSSVMVASAKRGVSDLDHEVNALAHQAKLTQDEMEASVDYLEIYRVATEEYGMIPASYVDSLYVDTTNGNSIEAYAAEEDEPIGLSSLLSAIGIRFGR